MKTFKGTLGGALTALFQLFTPTLGQGERSAGNGQRERKDGLHNEMLLHGKEHLDLALRGSASACLQTSGQSICLSVQPALFPQHWGLSYPDAQ